jgi:transposase
MSVDDPSELEIGGIRLPGGAWEATPASVQGLVATLLATIAQQQEQLDHLNKQVVAMSERLAHLEEQVRQSSQNSSKPPSSEGFGQGKRPPREGGNGRRGGQPGHEGQSRDLYPMEVCAEVIDHVPSVCRGCGEPLTGEDRVPYRHQIVDLPPIEPIVIEHRLHQLGCEHCGTLTRSVLPEGVTRRGYGERLSALVALLSGGYRQSHRQVQTLLAALAGIQISTGSINRLRQEMSDALAIPVAQALGYVQQSGVLHSDETSFTQGNGDGANESSKRAWIWVLVTPLVSVFAVWLSRSQAVAKTLMGETYDGIVVSDRYSGYGWLPVAQRQVCWAHLKRDFTRIAERSGVSQAIGEGLLAAEKTLFHLWYQVRDGTLTHEAFRQAVQPVQAEVNRWLQEAANYDIGPQEKTPLAKTVRTCRQLLAVESALWTFVERVGVEPTNNAAERALRPAVIWRRTSFGAQSQAGSEFVARMLTVVTSLQAQQRDVLDFLTQAIQAERLGHEHPDLRPQPSAEDETPLAA